MDTTPPRGALEIQAGKKKAIINWINSIGLAECIDSIHQLRDGRHLCQILSAIDQDIQLDGTESIQDRIQFINRFLETQYRMSMAGKINFNMVLDGDQFEIGKLSLLLLCAGLICTGNELFVESAVKLDTTDQLEIRDMAGTILTPNNDLELEGRWYAVLTRAGERSAFDIHSAPQTPTHGGAQTTFSTSMMQASADTSVLSRFASPSTSRYTPVAGSPVMQLVRSPTVANRIIIQKKEQKIKILQRELNSERHLRNEFENEVRILKEETIQEKENLIQKLENRIKVLRRQTLDLQVRADQIDDFEQEKNELTETLEMKTNKLKEYKDAKETAVQLQRENEELYDELDKQKAQVQANAGFKAESMKLKNFTVELQGNIAELRMDVSSKSQEIQILRESCETLQGEMMCLKESQRIDMKGNDTGNYSLAGECLNGVIEKELREQIEDLEEEISDLKAKLVSQMQKHKIEKQTMENRGIQKEGDLQKFIQELKRELDLQTQRAMSYEAEYTAKSEELEEIKNLMEAENIQLQEALESSRGQYKESASNLQELSERYNDLVKESNTLRETTALESEEFNSQVEAMMEQRDKLQAEIEELTQESNTMRATTAQESEEFNSQVEAMMEQRDKLQAEIDDRDKALDDHIETSHQKSILIDQLKDANTKLEADMETFSQKIEELEDSIDALEEERDDLKLQARQQEEKLQELQQAVDMSDSERTEWQQKALELEEQLSLNGDSSNEKIQGFQQQLKQARDRTSYFENLVVNFESKVCMLEQGFKAEVEKCEKGKETLAKELDSSKTKAEKMQEAFEASKKKMAEMDKRVAFYHDGVMKLEGEMRKCHAESSDKQSALMGDLALANKKVSELESAINKLKKERKNLIAEYEEEKSRAVKLEEALIQTENHMQDVEDELRTTKCTMTNLQESLNMTTAHASEKDQRLHEELKESHTRENQLQSELDQAQAFVNEVKLELEELQKNLPGELASTRDKNGKLKRKLEESNKEVTALKKTCEDLTKEKSAQQEYLESSQTNVNKMWNELQDHQKQVEELKKSLESSQADNERLWKELSDAKKEHEELQCQHNTDVGRLVTHEGYLQTSQDHQALLEDKLAKSREEVAMLEENLESAVSRAAKYEEEVLGAKSSASELETQLKEELKEAYAKEQELEENNDRAHETIAELEDKLEEAQANATQYLEEVKVITEQLEEAQTSATQYQEEVKVITEKLDDKEKQVADLEHKLQESMENAKASASQLESRLMEQLKEAHTKEQEMGVSIEKSRDVIRQLEVKLQANVTKSAEYDTQINVYMERIKEKEDAISAMEHQLRESINRSKNVEEDMKVSREELNKELKAATVKISELEGNLTEMKETTAKQTEKFEAKEGEMEFELLAAKSEVEEKSREIGELTKNFNVTREQMQLSAQNLQTLVNDKSSEISELEKTVQINANTITNYASKIESSTGKISELEEEIHNYKVKMSTVTQSVEVSGSLSNKFKTQLEQKEAAYKKLDSEVTQYQEQIKGLETQLQTSKRTNECLNEATNQLQDALSKLHVRLNTQEEAFKDLEENSKKESDELKLKMHTSESSLKSLKAVAEESKSSKQAKLKQKVEDLTARASKMEESHKQQLTKLETEFRAQYEKEAGRWKESMDQITASCKRARDRLEGKEKEYSHLKAMTDQFKADCSSKTKVVDDQNAQINSLRLRIAELEAKISELEGKRITRSRSSMSVASAVHRAPSPTPSTASRASTGSKVHRVPQGIFGMFEADDEPDMLPEFGILAELQRRQTTHGGADPAFGGHHIQDVLRHDPNRLSELQRRNTLCLPHLKTSYPVETQMRAPRVFNDDKLKHGQSPIIEEEPSSAGPLTRSSSRTTTTTTSTVVQRLTPDNQERGGGLKNRKRKSVAPSVYDSPEEPAEKRSNPDPTVVKLSTPGVSMYKAYSPRTRAQMRAAGLLNSGQKPGTSDENPHTPGLTGFSDLTINSPMVNRKIKNNSPGSGASVKSFKATTGKKKGGSKENMTFNIGFTPLRSARKLGRTVAKHLTRKPSTSSKSKPLADNNLATYKK